MKKSPVIRSDLARADGIPRVPDSKLPEFTGEMFDKAVWRIGGKVIPTPRRRGRPAGSGKKVSTTLRIDKEVLAGFRSGGRGWQTKMNDVLRAWLKKHPARKTNAARKRAG